MDSQVAYSLIDKCRRLADAERTQIDEYEAWFRGDFWDETRGVPVSPTVVGDLTEDDDDLNYETNYTYAFIDSMVANVCPMNPQVTINARHEDMKDQAKNQEALINDTMRRNAVHDICWDSAQHCAFAGRAPAKTVWNLQRKMPTVTSIDPRAFFYDRTVPFRHARWVCEAVPLTMDEFKRRLKRGSGFRYNREASEKVTSSGYPEWLRPLKSSMEKDESDAARDELQWVLIYEFYDLVGHQFWHFAEGVEEPLLERDKLPYKFVTNPYSLLIFNKDLKGYAGVPDIKLIANTLRRLNELTSLALRHAHKAIPKTVVNMSLLDNFEDFAEALSVSDDGDIVQVRAGSNPVPLDQIVSYTRPPPLPSEATTMIAKAMEDIDFVLGSPQYQRGKTGTSDVATELALIDTASRTRNGRRVKVMGDFVIDIAKKIGGLWQEFMDEGRQLPVRAAVDSADTMMLDRETLGFDDAERWDDENLWDETWFYDFDVVAFSPTENHRLVQLNKMQQQLTQMFQLPGVNQLKLTRKFLELLGFEDCFDDKAQPTSMPGQPGQQPAQSKDTVAGGKMPEGADYEDLTHVDPRAMAQQATGGS